MSFDVNWNIDKYRDVHESDEHWQLRRAFLVKWKNDYPEDRLVCLARVFTNVELLGCRYPPEVMQEISRLSYEVAEPYRKLRKTKLQRTFVSASDAAEDRAKGIKRKGGVVEDSPKAKIQFVTASIDNNNINNDDHREETSEIIDNNKYEEDIRDKEPVLEKLRDENSKIAELNNYMEDMLRIKCLNVRGFKEQMFMTAFGRLVLLVRPWAGKLWNIQTSCQVCNIPFNTIFENRCLSMTINGQLVAQATGDSKADAKAVVESMAWERICQEVISIVVKEQFIAQNDTRISVNDVSGKRSSKDDMFGTPVENTVAMKMMRMMGWKGGGLGADSQGIAEPIKPNLQLVNRAGLGSTSSDIRQLRKAAFGLMERYIASDTLDLDLVFSSDFSKEERALMHQCAQRVGLASKSYGSDQDRFLVVKKKLDPFSLVRAVIEKGGVTPKYQVFIPATLAVGNRRRR